jgi:hypothetical protein
MTSSATFANALDSPTFQAIARAGSIERDELAYQLDKRGQELDDLELEQLAEAGHIEADGRLYSVVIPEPRQRAGGGVKNGDGGNGYTHDEILDRVKLWALLVGRPPSITQWHISDLNRQIARLRVRLEHHERVQALYESGDWPAVSTVVNRFGSMNAALVAAGFEPRGPGQQPDVPVIPGKPWRPKAGEEAVDAAIEHTREARAAGDQEQLHEALIELAIAAFNEADKIEKWDPEGGA